jgi:hypothetical protein
MYSGVSPDIVGHHGQHEKVARGCVGEVQRRQEQLVLQPDAHSCPPACAGEGSRVEGVQGVREESSGVPRSSQFTFYTLCVVLLDPLLLNLSTPRTREGLPNRPFPSPLSPPGRHRRLTVALVRAQGARLPLQDPPKQVRPERSHCLVEDPQRCQHQDPTQVRVDRACQADDDDGEPNERDGDSVSAV